MSNANNGFTGWLKKNPGMAMGSFLFIVALIVLVGWIINRGSKGSKGPGAASSLPELEVSGEKLVKSTKTSDYTMKYEYALGDYLGDNIDFTITVNTKSGFEQNGINKLMVKRYGPPPPSSTETKTLLGEMEITSVENYKSYEVTFLGSALKKDAVPATGGKQFFEVIGYMVDGSTTTEYDSGTPLATTSGTTNEPEITPEDLNYVLTKATTTPFTWTVTGASGLSFAKSDAIKSKYTLSIIPNDPVLLIPVTGSTAEYKFQKVSDPKTFFEVEGVNTFTLDKPDAAKDEYLLYATKTGESTSSIVTRTGGTIDGALVLKDPRDMTGDEFSMARVTISEYKTIAYPVGSGVYCNSAVPGTTLTRGPAYHVSPDFTLQAYPDPGVASSWLGPDWVSKVSWVDCTGYKEGPAIGKNPKSPGSWVRCNGGRPAGVDDRFTVFRVMEDGTTKMVTNAGNAGSWDGNWASIPTWVDDCSDLNFDGELPYKPA